MINLILIIFFIYFNKSFCSETQFKESLQICRLTVPKEQNNCFQKSNKDDSDFACCYITLNILNDETQICDYLEYKVNDALYDEKDKLKNLYNAKNIKIYCTQNSGYFLTIKIVFILFILFI